MFSIFSAKSPVDRAFDDVLKTIDGFTSDLKQTGHSSSNRFITGIRNGAKAAAQYTAETILPNAAYLAGQAVKHTAIGTGKLIKHTAIGTGNLIKHTAVGTIDLAKNTVLPGAVNLLNNAIDGLQENDKDQEEFWSPKNKDSDQMVQSAQPLSLEPPPRRLGTGKRDTDPSSFAQRKSAMTSGMTSAMTSGMMLPPPPPSGPRTSVPGRRPGSPSPPLPPSPPPLPPAASNPVVSETISDSPSTSSFLDLFAQTAQRVIFPPENLDQPMSPPISSSMSSPQPTRQSRLPVPAPPIRIQNDIEFIETPQKSQKDQKADTVMLDLTQSTTQSTTQSATQHSTRRRPMDRRQPVTATQPSNLLDLTGISSSSSSSQSSSNVPIIDIGMNDTDDWRDNNQTLRNKYMNQ